MKRDRPVSGRAERRCREPGGARKACGDAPQVGHLHGLQARVYRRLVGQNAEAFLARVFLRKAVGDLGERFGGGNADRHRNARPALYRPAQLAGVRFKPRLDPGNAEKGFVDGIDFEIGV
jgi:hypothetical protein